MLAPWFLVGLLGIGLPWWLHRLARSETTPQSFPSLMLLESSDLRDTRKRQLRYLGLLLLRIALLLALVLAFVQPQWFANVPKALANQARMQVIVLDTSVSMRAGTRWQQAREQAIKLLDDAHASDQLMLIAAAGRQVKVLAGPVAGVERARVRAALEDLQPSLQRLDLGMALATVKAWKMPNGLPVDLHLISDLQASGSPQRFADLEPPAGAKLYLHSVQDQQLFNAGINSVTMSGGERRLLTVNVVASGDMTQTNAESDKAPKSASTVSVSVDEKEIGKRVVQWTADGSASISFADVQLTPGMHRIDAQLHGSDALSEDNHFYAVIDHADPRVLLVARNPQADEVAYLAAAIESLNAPRLTVTRITPEQLGAQTLADYAAIIVADSGVLGAVSAQKLRQHVMAGGSLLLTFGPQTLRVGSDPITAMNVREVASDAARIGAVDDSHPVLREPEAWRGVRFFKRLQVTPAKDDRQLLRFEDGMPLLLERPFEVGHLLILAAPLDREWNDLAVHPLFVRFISEAARYLTGSDAAAVSAIVGTNVATGIASGTASGTASGIEMGSGGQIFDPTGKRVSSLDGSDNVTRLMPEQSGFYEVRSANHTRFIAANVDARESNLTPLDAETLRRWQLLEKPLLATTTNNESAATQYRRDLGPFLLMLAALLALLELLLANYRLQVIRDA